MTTVTDRREDPPGRARSATAAWACALAVALLTGPVAVAAAPDTTAGPAPPAAKVTEVVDLGLKFLARSQKPDGSIGDTQTHLQTALTILAFLSAGRTPTTDAASPIGGAGRWLLKYSGEDGFLGDRRFSMESHAVGALALSELGGMIPDAKLSRRISHRAAAALSYALTAQDKAVGAEFYGGWRADQKNKRNDRRVTAWYLLLLRSASLRGAKIPRSATERALLFMEGSQKTPADGKSYDKTDLGGFSHDATGLPVVSITGAGLASLSYYRRPSRRRDLALKWLRNNRPLWYGPNFYYTHLFTSRALVREARRGPAPARQDRRYARRLWEMLRDHQNPDGSFQVPPGNAENTRTMGKTYATAMAVLILNARRRLMPVDGAR